MDNRLAMFLILSVALAAIFSSATFYASSPRPLQQFMSFGVYSETGLQQYLPTPNATISTGQHENWTLSVQNFMGAAQLIMILARIGNSSLTPLNHPITPVCSPAANTTSPATCFPQITIASLFIGDGEKTNVNFDWTLESITNQTGRTILGLRVNGENLTSTPVGANQGQNFRWIFELWTFNQNCSDSTSASCFHYGFGSQTAPTGTWLQVWFNPIM